MNVNESHKAHTVFPSSILYIGREGGVPANHKGRLIDLLNYRQETVYCYIYKKLDVF